MYAYTDSQPRTYRASATIFVNQSAAPNAITYSDALLNQQLVKTYSRMATEPVVIDEVRSRLNLSMSTSEVAAMVSADPVRDTQLIQIAAVGRSPQLITDIANATAETFIDQQTVYLPEDQQGNALRVAQPALTPTDPIGPMPLRNGLLAAFLGLLIAAGLVWLLEYLDDTIKTPESLEQSTGLATLGVVPKHGAKDSIEAHALVSSRKGNPATEAYRLVRTNLEFASVDHELRSILVTSTSSGDGKTTVAANMATILAQANRSVILVDADLRRPTLHTIFGTSNAVGLSSLLLNPDASPQNNLYATKAPGLRVLPSGPIPPNPAELLASPRLPVVLAKLTELADIVIFDSPPIMAVADPVILANRVDGTLIVVDSSRTRAEALQRSIDQISKSGTLLLGGILNKLPRRHGGYYSYYYQGAYGGDSSSGDESDATPPLRRPRFARSRTE